MKTETLRVRYTARKSTIIVRAAQPDADALQSLIFRRYPSEEWATFATFGWLETPAGLVLTLAGLDPPSPGDLDETASHVVLNEPYTLRTALKAERQRLAVGVIHSHPEGCGTTASPLDDDMDCYYSGYFSGFAPDRPYISLIFARSHDGAVLSATGRVFWKGEWHRVSRFLVQGQRVMLTGYDPPPSRRNATGRAQVARLESAFGEEAAERLDQATVAVIGASGTGSPVIEALARAGVGHLIVVDPDVFNPANLERLHGSWHSDIGKVISKVAIAKRHVRQINPACRVTAIRGALPQKEVVDALCMADIVIGCTDQQHSRVALNDLALRYLVPVLDCGVEMEGEAGLVTGQIIQILRLFPADACVYCREMVVQWKLDQELMSEKERTVRRAAAQEAEAQGRRGDAYWRDIAQMNTVGYLTTTAGGMIAGYAIGYVTARFATPFSRLQMNLSAPFLDVTDDPIEPLISCACRRMRGTSDQGMADELITAPSHWHPAEMIL